MLILRIQHTLGLCNGNNLRGGDDVGGERHPAGAGQGRQADVLWQVRVTKKSWERRSPFLSRCPNGLRVHQVLGRVGVDKGG